MSEKILNKLTLVELRFESEQRELSAGGANPISKPVWPSILYRKV
jgi:hypothetical protein